MSDPPSSQEYLVISRGQWSPDLPKETIQRAIDDFYQWLSEMVDAGKMRTGSRLGTAGATVSAARGVVTDGPFGEAKEAVGGYWYILAASLEEAAETASGNPCLACGLFYEIRPLDPEPATAFTRTTETPEVD